MTMHEVFALCRSCGYGCGCGYRESHDDMWACLDEGVGPLERGNDTSAGHARVGPSERIVRPCARKSSFRAEAQGPSTTNPHVTETAQTDAFIPLLIPPKSKPRACISENTRVHDRYLMSIRTDGRWRLTSSHTRLPSARR